MEKPVALVKQPPSGFRFALGSTSSIKLMALCLALERLGFKNPKDLVKAVAAASGINPQPLDYTETLQGARNRALAAAAAWPERLAIGIENGLMEEDGGFCDLGVVLVRAPDMTEFVANSETLPFPAEAVEEARRLGFDKTTVGEILAKGHPDWIKEDPHVHLDPQGRSRIRFLAPAVERAVRNALQHFIEVQNRPPPPPPTWS